MLYNLKNRGGIPLLLDFLYVKINLTMRILYSQERKENENDK